MHARLSAVTPASLIVRLASLSYLLEALGSDGVVSGRRDRGGGGAGGTMPGQWVHSTVPREQAGGGGAARRQQGNC